MGAGWVGKEMRSGIGDEDERERERKIGRSLRHIPFVLEAQKILKDKRNVPHYLLLLWDGNECDRRFLIGDRCKLCVSL